MRPLTAKSPRDDRKNSLGSGSLGLRLGAWSRRLLGLSLIALTLGLSALGGLVSAEPYALSHPKAEGVVRVHFIDIGQGDSALIEGPTGKRVLIDSGPSKSGKQLISYLKALKIERLDLMINTHPHSDHIGNAAKLLRSFEVGVVLDSGWLHPIRAYRDLMEAIEETKVPLRIARKGRKIDIGGGASLHILGPEEPLIRNSRSDPNSNSVVFRLSYRGEAALFTGDAEEETESRLMRAPEHLSASLLKVAHHGSRHASSDHFLNAVRPKVAVISCSESNRYGHPAPETLKRLQRHGVQHWVTASQGTLVAETSGEGWSLNGGPQLKRGEEAPSATPSESARDMSAQVVAEAQPSAPQAGLLNINSATAAQLQSLPGIGPALSKRIIKSREEEGPFSSASELSRVRGIGPKTVEKLKALVSF